MKVDVARRVDEVEFVELSLMPVFHADGPGLDRDAPLPLQLHIVEHLLLEETLLDRARAFEEPVGQRALAVVDVGDDGEVADVFAVDAHAGIVDEFRAR